MKKTNEIMFELEDQRQANRKIYRMKNGQNMMILGREPVHYFDVESEEYKEIDGTLKNTSGGYVGQFGNCRVSLPNGKGNDRVIRIGNDLHKIEWRYSGMNKDRFDDAYETNGMAYSVPKIVYKKRFPNIKHNNPDAHFGENAVVRYDNIEDGIGFEYEVRTNCLKENIYISKLREKYSFFYDLKVRGVKPIISDDKKEIVFCENGSDAKAKALFRIPVPFMQDASGARSGDVSYNIIELNKSHYRFEIKADENWINNSARVLPINIDPVISFEEIWKETLSDSFASFSGTQDENGNYIVGYSEEQKMTFSAEIGMRGPLDGNTIVDAYLLIYDSGIEQTYATTTYDCTITVSPIEGLEENVIIDPENTDFVITYYDEFAYADNQTYLQIAGNGELNPYSGEITYYMEDMNIGGALMPAVLTHFYNVNNTATTNYGRRWNLSINQKLESYNYATLKATYTDGSGKKAYFILEDYGTYTIRDVSGRDLSLGDNSVCDRKGNMLIFDENGDLIKLIDRNDNYIEIERNKKHQPIKVTDSFGRVTILTYENNRLVKITDHSGRIVSYEYDAKGELIKAIFPDDSTIEYTYTDDDSGYLTKIKDRSGIIHVIEYCGSSPNRILQYPIGSDTSEAAEEYIDIEYRGRQKSTAISDRSGIRQVYVFDKNGRTVYSYEDISADSTEGDDKNRIQVTGTVLYCYDDEKSKLVYTTSVRQADGTENFIKNGSFEEDYSENDPWEKRSIYSDGEIVTGHHVDGSRSYCGRYVKQTILPEQLSFNCGNTLVLSAWAKTDYYITSEEEKVFELRGEVYYTDRKKETVSDSIFKAEFDMDYSGWQYAAIPIRIDMDRPLEKIVVYLDASDNSKATYFDNVRMVNCPAKSVDYGEKDKEYPAITVFGKKQNVSEKVISSDGIYTITEEKAGRYDVIRRTVTDADGNEFVSYAEYDGNHNPIYTQDYRGIMTAYEYNDKGQPTSEKTWHCAEMNPSTIPEPTEFFLKTMTYDETGEFLAQEGDQRSDSIFTSNTYDKTKCLLLGTTTPNGQTTSYTYDAATDLVTKVSADTGDCEYSVLYGYENRRLSTITHNGFNYGFTYDGMGRTKEVKIADTVYSSNEYTLTDTTTVTTTYAGGEKMTVETDRHQQPIKRTYTDKNGKQIVLAESEYDSLGKIVKTVDKLSDLEYNYKYDGFDNVIEETHGATSISNTFDSNNRLVGVHVTLEDLDQNSAPIYDKTPEGNIYPDNAIVGISYNNNELVSTITKDVYGRTVGRDVILDDETQLVKERYGYYSSEKSDGNRLTSMINSITQSFGDGGAQTLFYDYDSNGNIINIYHDGTLIVHYTYDSMNQLVREDNAELIATYVYEYDTAGNILCQKIYPYTVEDLGTPIGIKTYSYATTGWKDKLVAVDDRTITYDEIGNPITYLGYNLTWDNVRQLKNFGYHSFDYQADGKRFRKNEIWYAYQGDKLLREIHPDNTVLTFLYDTSGILGFTYRSNFTFDEDGTPHFDEKRYFYKKNLQGDVIAVYDDLGAKYAEYKYDAWGNCTVTKDIDGVAELNPIRYRSYYYDIETDLYYLNSRYYNPEIGRFINADCGIPTKNGILGYNIYSYCLNNPISFVDNSGKNSDVATWWGASMWWLSGVDTVLPFGDMIYFGGLAILGFIAIATADDAPNISRSEVKDRTEEKDAVIEIQLKKQAYFTINPYDFTPIGLILVTYPGSKNGRIFKWKDPVSGMTVFEWDEDFAKGSHYHALMVEWNDIHLGPHYVPGTPVPEPWNSLYFGG